jgi:hypothetical protein
LTADNDAFGEEITNKIPKLEFELLRVSDVPDLCGLQAFSGYPPKDSSGRLQRLVNHPRQRLINHAN